MGVRGVRRKCSFCGKTLTITKPAYYKNVFCDKNHYGLWLAGKPNLYHSVGKGWKQTPVSNKKRSMSMKGQNNLSSERRSEIVKRFYQTPAGDRRRLEDSIRMKNGGAAHSNHFIKNPSKPQIDLFKLALSILPSPVLNYPIYNPKSYSIDIAVPCLAVAIEYDGSYYHQNDEYDSKRQEELEEQGWKFIRYRDKVPSKEKFVEDVLRV